MPWITASPADFRVEACKQAAADEEAFMPGLKLLGVAAKTEDSQVLLAASRVNNTAQTARLYVRAACRGQRNADTAFVCKAAMDWALYGIVTKDEFDRSITRLKPAAQIFRGDLEAAYEAATDAISDYAIFLRAEYNCLPKQ